MPSPLKSDPTAKPFIVYVSAKDRLKLKIRAARLGTSMSALVRKALADAARYPDRKLRGD